MVDGGVDRESSEPRRVVELAVRFRSKQL